jgi:3-deoxy-D-manno-octulosonate 8-phosphate phosphatase (KDO 8-P phosphatase)
MAIITGRTSNVVAKRAENIKIKKIYQGVEDKLEAFEQVLEDFSVSPEQCAFMGDDVVDLPPMRRCGLAVTVPHAMPLVKQYSHYITNREAGFGAVRELCELIMQAQDTFDQQMAEFLK